jgi:hypothetical protein
MACALHLWTSAWREFEYRSGFAAIISADWSVSAFVGGIFYFRKIACAFAEFCGTRRPKAVHVGKDGCVVFFIAHCITRFLFDEMLAGRQMAGYHHSTHRPFRAQLADTLKCYPSTTTSTVPAASVVEELSGVIVSRKPVVDFWLAVTDAACDASALTT